MNVDRDLAYLTTLQPGETHVVTNTMAEDAVEVYTRRVDSSVCVKCGVAAEEECGRPALMACYRDQMAAARRRPSA